MKRRELLKALLAAPLAAVCAQPSPLRKSDYTVVGIDPALKGQEFTSIVYQDVAYEGVWPMSRVEYPSVREAQRAWSQIRKNYLDELYRAQGLVIEDG